MLGVKLKHHRRPWRHSDQKFFVADIGKAKRLLQCSPRRNKREAVKLMLKWTEKAVGI